MARIAAALIDDLRAFYGYKCKQSKEAQIIPYKHPRKWDYQLDQERKKSSAARAPNDAQKRQNDS